MKIALTGAHGTGKTTLCSRLGSNLANGTSFAICREVPRVIIGTTGDGHFFQRGHNTPLRQMMIFLYQIVEEDDCQRSAEIVISIVRSSTTLRTW